MHIPITQRALLLVAMLLSVFSTHQSFATESKKPLSPYFFIEGGGSGLKDELGEDLREEKLPLKKSTAEVQLNGLIATVKLTQVYRNEGNHPISATYIFPGSTHAAVNGMTMTVGERRIVAKIKEKEQAKKIFKAAKKAGKTASLLSQKRPNVFSMKVANIMPGDEVSVDLNYTELINAEDGVYEFVYPGVVGPRYGGDAEHSALETAWIQNPYLAEGAAKGVDDAVEYGISVNMASPLPIGSLESPSHQLTTHWQNKNTVKVSLENNKDAGNRDFILRYRLQDNQIITGLTHFQSGKENYFLLVGEPPQRITPEQIPARDYFFVVDVSGSMFGFPLDTTKQLMADLLGNLKPSDRFNILFFSGGSNLLSPQPLAATAGNIARATQMMNNQVGGGGTALYPALQKVLAMESDENASRNIVLVTDGYISAEQRVFNLIDENLHRNNLFAFGIGSSVNRHLIEGVAKAGRAEAFVVTNQAEARKIAKKFNEYISAPALTNIRLVANGLEIYDMEPPKIPDMLAQRPIMVIGKYRSAPLNSKISTQSDASITLRGITGNGPQEWSFQLDQAQNADSTLPQLWARKRLERLYIFPNPDKEQQRQEIVQLGLNYSLLTRHTAFVAVDETIRNTSGKSKDVKQPLPLPKGVSNKAVGRPMPEPELLWFGLIALFVRIMSLVWRKRHAVQA